MAREAKAWPSAVLSDIRLAKQLWPNQMSKLLVRQLRGLIERHGLSLLSGDVGGVYRPPAEAVQEPQ
jgi:hypothetical protein